jgi:selenocysteine lyase/cysteine desulfurase
VSSAPAADDIARRVRAEFPYLNECVYLNTAAAGVSWAGQGPAAARFYDDAKRLGINGMSVWRATAERARASIARLLGVAEHEVRFAASTTEGLHLVIGAIPWRAADEIVVAADEFPSVLRACERAAAFGPRIRRVSSSTEADREAALLAAITPATRLVAVSHVHWATGTRLNLVRVSAACRLAGAFLVVDGVQGIGAVDSQLGDTDAICGSVFKWLLSGFGLAVVVVRDHARARLAPAVRGYNNPSPVTELQYSHVNYPGIYALAATLDFIEEAVGWAAVFRQVQSLTTQLIGELERLGLTVVTPSDPSSRAGIVACRVANPDRVRHELAAQGIHVESREGLLRVSPHFYNTTDDIRTFAEALGRFV